MTEDILQTEYKRLFIQIKEQINSGQTKAALAVNNALIQLYWNLGKMIADNQALFEGRNSFIAQLANDLNTEFPGISGFSKGTFLISVGSTFFTPPIQCNSLSHSTLH